MITHCSEKSFQWCRNAPIYQIKNVLLSQVFARLCKCKLLVWINAISIMLSVVYRSGNCALIVKKKEKKNFKLSVSHIKAFFSKIKWLYNHEDRCFSFFRSQDLHFSSKEGTHPPTPHNFESEIISIPCDMHKWSFLAKSQAELSKGLYACEREMNAASTWWSGDRPQRASTRPSRS